MLIKSIEKPGTFEFVGFIEFVGFVGFVGFIGFILEKRSLLGGRRF